MNPHNQFAMSYTTHKEPVTVVSQVFHPDSSANAGLLTELAVELSARGYNVSALTTQPSYTLNDRCQSEPKKEQFSGVTIRRLPATRFDRNRGLLYRMTNEITFFVVVFLYLLYRRFNGAETVFLPTSPTFLPLLAWPLSILGYRCIPIVMDLYPDMAVELGYLSKNGVVYRVWEWMNRCAYHRADQTVVIGETMKSTLQEKYGRNCDIMVIHNWADGEVIKPQPKDENPFVREYGLQDELTILYSGNLGRHHDLESVIQAAARLDRDTLSTDLHFLFIGEGGKKEALQRMVTEQEISSVSFLPYQPREVLPNSLTAGDISIVTMEPGVEGLCVSSKFYTALASGTAILAIASPDSEIGKIVDQTDCGIRVDPKSPEKVVDAIRYWESHPTSVTKMGIRARTLFNEEFSKPHAIDAYEHLLTENISSQ